jgi:hypothetical protein
MDQMGPHNPMALESPHKKINVSKTRFTLDDINTMTVNTNWFLLQIRDILTMKAY